MSLPNSQHLTPLYSWMFQLRNAFAVVIIVKSIPKLTTCTTCKTAHQKWTLKMQKLLIVFKITKTKEVTSKDSKGITRIS